MKSQRTTEEEDSDIEMKSIIENTGAVKKVLVREHRKSKEEASRKISKMNEEIEVEEIIDKSVDVIKRKVSAVNVNMGKQFTKLTEHCDRKNFSAVNEDKGNAGLLTVNFQAGVFDAMRKFMMKVLTKDYDAELVKEANVEVMGSSGNEVETRVMFDIQITLNEIQHLCKVKVYNTLCSMDFQSIGENIYKEYEHLNNMTVGRYLATKVVPDVIEKIADEYGVDFKKLNNQWRKQATEATKAMNKEACPRCEKPKNNRKSLKCKDCNVSLHVQCEKKSDKFRTELEALEYQCRKCITVAAKKLVTSGDLDDDSRTKDKVDNADQTSIEHESEETETILALPPPPNAAALDEGAPALPPQPPIKIDCNECVSVFQNKEELNNHMRKKHQIRTQSDGVVELEDAMQLTQPNNTKSVDENEEDKNSHNQKITDLEKIHAAYKENKEKEILELKDMITKLKDIITETEEEYKNDLNRLRAEKLKVDGELMNSTKSRKKSEETERILLKTFECMTEVLESKGYRVTRFYSKEEDVPLINDHDEIRLETVVEANTPDSNPIHSDQEIESPRIAFSCEICDFKSDSKNKVRKHKRTNHKLEVFPCDHCDFKAVASDDLKYHKTMVHDKPSVRQRFPCEQCDFIGASNNNLKNHLKEAHIKSHMINRIHCQQCDFVANSPDELNKHTQASHSPNLDKPRSLCDYCTYSANSWTDLIPHINAKHGTEIPENTSERHYHDLYCPQSIYNQHFLGQKKPWLYQYQKYQSDYQGNQSQGPKYHQGWRHQYQSHQGRRFNLYNYKRGQRYQNRRGQGYWQQQQEGSPYREHRHQWSSEQQGDVKISSRERQGFRYRREEFPPLPTSLRNFY